MQVGKEGGSLVISKPDVPPPSKVTVPRLVGANGKPILGAASARGAAGASAPSAEEAAKPSTARLWKETGEYKRMHIDYKYSTPRRDRRETRESRATRESYESASAAAAPTAAAPQPTLFGTVRSGDAQGNKRPDATTSRPNFGTQIVGKGAHVSRELFSK